MPNARKQSFRLNISAFKQSLWFFGKSYRKHQVPKVFFRGILANVKTMDQNIGLAVLFQTISRTTSPKSPFFLLEEVCQKTSTNEAVWLVETWFSSLFSGGQLRVVFFHSRARANMSFDRYRHLLEHVLGFYKNIPRALLARTYVSCHTCVRNNMKHGWKKLAFSNSPVWTWPVKPCALVFDLE